MELSGKEIVTVSDSKVAVSWVYSEGIGNLDNCDAIYDIRDCSSFLPNVSVVFKSKATNSFADSLAKRASTAVMDFIDYVIEQSRFKKRFCFLERYDWKGLPYDKAESDEVLVNVTLMFRDEKINLAAYTVGGHSYSAAAIEYVILKMKPPLHIPQIALLLALHKLKVSEEQRKSAIDTYEPLVAVALSCGMYSSPAVRIYTAKNVKEELQEAQHDFIRGSVGVSSKGKLLVPKMLHCFAKGFVDDANLAVWISHYLPPLQAAFVEQCVSKRRQSLLGSRNCGILTFDSRFRLGYIACSVNLDKDGDSYGLLHYRPVASLLVVVHFVHMQVNRSLLSTSSLLFLHNSNFYRKRSRVKLKSHKALSLSLSSCLLCFLRTFRCDSA
ncbi:hypothetical protein Q3G72_023129 [Acer saccharum]|nr:hypothetical protein Q3G72_023129 [Acer saccharum]